MNTTVLLSTALPTVYVAVGLTVARYAFQDGMKNHIEDISEFNYEQARENYGGRAAVFGLIWPVFLVGAIVFGIIYCIGYGPWWIVTSGVNAKRKRHLQGEPITQTKDA